MNRVESLTLPSPGTRGGAAPRPSPPGLTVKAVTSALGGSGFHIHSTS